jgi:hypothetical protein
MPLAARILANTRELLEHYQDERELRVAATNRGLSAADVSSSSVDIHADIHAIDFRFGGKRFRILFKIPDASAVLCGKSHSLAEPWSKIDPGDVVGAVILPEQGY